MKLHILCEKCGCDNYKSYTSLIQFKYRSTYHVPIFECVECGQEYAVAATLKAFVFNQCFCFIQPLIFSIWFAIEEKIFDDSEFVLEGAKGRGVGRGRISKIVDTALPQ